MSKVNASYFQEYREGVPSGPATQFSPTFPTIPTLDVAGGAAPSFTSAPILSEGFRTLAVSLQATRAGTLSVQRFLDDACLIPVGAAVTATLVAAVQNWVTIADDVPFSAFKFTVANTDGVGGHTSVVSNGGVLMQGG